MFDPTELEEDRRLCYVAVTRAREELYITHAKSRMLYGQTTRNAASRFLLDIPEELVEEENRCRTPQDFGEGFGGSRYGRESAGGRSGYGGYAGSQGGGYTYTARQEIAPFPHQRTATPASTVTVGKAPAAVSTTKWQVGDRVKSSVFGEGTIVSMSPMAGDTLLVIQFDSIGQKKLMANYAKLTAI
jgi:DNA helicase-2/ATP-dependent DNA helicase PcrA